MHGLLRRTLAGRQLGLILGVMATILASTAIAYFWAWQNVWNSFQASPAIGAEPLEIKIVAVVKDIPAGGEITMDNVDERHETLKHVAFDAFGFASECLGRKTKWPIKKGAYLSKHDVLPENQSSEVK